MPDYTPITDFEVKDGLAHLDPEKIVSGGEIQAELDAIAAAIRSKVGSTFNMISAVQTEEVAQVISDMLFEVGMILPWYGSTLDIPTGWALCDGTNGTPDLRDKFVVGAGSTYNLSATGGSTSTGAGGAGSTGSHTLTTAEIPAHTHTVSYRDGVYGGGANHVQSVEGVDGTSTTSSTGGGGGHSHTLADHTHTALPPYYGLYYIMYTGFDTDAGIGNTDTPLNTGLVPVWIQLACSDLSTALTTGSTKGYFRAPSAFTITQVKASLATASSSGVVTIDINKNGSTILSTKLTIDANEKTSVTAATAYVITDTAAAADDEFTIDIDGAGTGAKGLIVTVVGIT